MQMTLVIYGLSFFQLNKA